VRTKRSRRRALTLVCVVIGLTACGGKKAEDKPPPVKIDAAPNPTGAPIAIPRSGVDRIERMNFQWGSAGSRDYAKALYALRAKSLDWSAVRTHAEAALAKDAQHLGAHWLLAVALSQLGEYPAAVDHLVTAIAADYFKYGVALADSKNLQSFLATPHGTAVTELAAKIGEDFRHRVAKALLVVGRRSSFRWPSKNRPHESTSRGELYAYDRETRQYLRLTHTGDTVVGFVRSASGEISVLGYDRIDRDPDAPPMITRAYVMTLDADYKPGPRTVLDDPVRELGLGYTGSELVITTAPASGRWGTGEISTWTVDPARHKAVKSTLPPPIPRIVFSLEEAHLVRIPDGVEAAWTGDPAVATGFAVGGKKVAIPESGSVARMPASMPA